MFVVNDYNTAKVMTVIKEKKCVYEYHEDDWSSYLTSSCGEEYLLEKDTQKPGDGHWSYCCRCGGKIEVVFDRGVDDEET